jgi:hypothetical protein
MELGFDFHASLFLVLERRPELHGLQIQPLEKQNWVLGMTEMQMKNP